MLISRNPQAPDNFLVMHRGCLYNLGNLWGYALDPHGENRGRRSQASLPGGLRHLEIFSFKPWPTWGA